MISAATIKPIIDASTWASPDHYIYQGNPRYIASVDGVWQPTPESDLFHIDQDNFIAVQGATSNPADGGASLLVDVEGEPEPIAHELTATRIAGVRWCILSPL